MALCTADFEAGTHGSNVQAADPGSATAWDDVTVAGGSETIKYDNTHSYGDLACKIISAGGEATMSWTTALGTVTDSYGRLYMWSDSNPTGATLRLVTSTPGYIGLFIPTSGLIAINLYNGGGLSFTTPIALGQWVRLEWHVIHSTTAGQMEVKLFNSPDSETPTETKATSASADTGSSSAGLTFGVGSGSASTATLWLDNIVAGATDWVGPEAETIDVLAFSHGMGMGNW